MKFEVLLNSSSALIEWIRIDGSLMTFGTHLGQSLMKYFDFIVISQSNIFSLPEGYTFEAVYNSDPAHEIAHPACGLTEFFKKPWSCTLSEGPHFHFQLLDADRDPAELTTRHLKLILDTLISYQANTEYRQNMLDNAKNRYPQERFPTSITDFIDVEGNLDILKDCCNNLVTFGFADEALIPRIFYFAILFLIIALATTCLMTYFPKKEPEPRELKRLK